ncbi:MAG: hypothetical protein QOF73_1731 [Thermomicrobiales bacterium]|nr:hypothetical protein [Thermomicrobiales bacterium]
MPDRRVGASGARADVEAVSVAAARWDFPGIVGNQGLDVDDIPDSATCPVPESAAERTNRPIVTAGRGTSSSCPDTMREALPVVGEDCRQNAPTVCDSHGHPVRCLKLTDRNRLKCNPAWLPRRDDDEGMSIVIIWGATRQCR